MTSRDAQRKLTRIRIVHAASKVLVAHGVAATTTVAVQEAAEVSRGALLHHFATREDLLAAAIRWLIHENEETARAALAATMPGEHPIDRALRVLGSVVTKPTFAAEMELWTASRTDTALRSLLQQEEKTAAGDLRRVVDAAFGEEIAAHPAYPRVASLTVEFLRGLAVSSPLRRRKESTRQLLEYWAIAVRLMLES
jgi:AcrR family transcriptional regulator